MELLIQALLMLENSNVKKQTLLSLQLLINCAPVCLRGFFCNHDRRLNQNDDRFIVPICIAYWKREREHIDVYACHFLYTELQNL